MKVSRKDVKHLIDATFPEYRGRKISLVSANEVLYFDLNWSGGTRNVYRTTTITGRPLNGAGEFNAAPPRNNPLEGQTLPLPSGYVCVQHSDFCGKDCGLTIYVNPNDMPKWLSVEHQVW